MYFVKRDGHLRDACDECLNFMKTCLRIYDVFDIYGKLMSQHRMLSQLSFETG